MGEHSYEPVASFRLRLPEGREFVAKTKLRRVIVEAFEAHLDKVQLIGVNSQDMTTEEAHRVAVRYAEEFGLDRRPLDRWLRLRLAQRRAGREELLERAGAGDLSTPPIGRDGPVPAVEINYTADDHLPSYVSVQFDWTKLGPG